jgi:hypothetical protein
MRLHAQTAMIENGFVHIPEAAPWLAEYLHELAVFPNGKHDDQADSTAQFLDWFKMPFLGQGIYELYRQQAAAPQTATHQNRVRPRLDGMARRAEEIGLSRGVYFALAATSGRARNRSRRGRGTEGSNPSPSSRESAANLTSEGVAVPARKAENSAQS